LFGPPEAPCVRAGGFAGLSPGLPGEQRQRFSRANKVRNLMEVGLTLRSWSQVQSDRYPGAPLVESATHPRVVSWRDWKAHEGRATAQRLDWKPRGGGRSGEHRLCRGVTPATRVRTLSRSKTLKSRAHAHWRLLPDDLKTSPVSSSWTLCITPRWGRLTSLQFDRTARRMIAAE